MAVFRQNWGSECCFEVLNGSKSHFVQTLIQKWKHAKNAFQHCSKNTARLCLKYGLLKKKTVLLYSSHSAHNHSKRHCELVKLKIVSLLKMTNFNNYQLDFEKNEKSHNVQLLKIPRWTTIAHWFWLLLLLVLKKTLQMDI